MQPSTNKNNLQPNMDQMGMQNHEMGNTNYSYKFKYITGYTTAKTSHFTTLLLQRSCCLAEAQAGREGETHRPKLHWLVVQGFQRGGC